MGIDDLYASNRSYDGAVPGAANPIDCIGPLWYVGGIGCRSVFPILLELLHLLTLSDDLELQLEGSLRGSRDPLLVTELKDFEDVGPECQLGVRLLST